MSPLPTMRGMIANTLLNARWWYRCAANCVGIAMIAVLLKITFGSSQINEPIQPHIIVSSVYWRLRFTRGWPWEFRAWSHGGFGQIFEEDWRWSPWALAGDALIFTVAVVGIAYLTWRVARSPRWTLRWVGVALTLVCIVGAWFANAYHRSRYDLKVCRELDRLNAYPADKYVDPRWFQQLVGETGGARKLFYRISDEEALDYPFKPEHYDSLVAAMAKRRGLRRLCFVSGVSMINDDGKVTRERWWSDKDVVRLFQLPSLHGLHEMDLSESNITSEALAGVADFKELRAVDLSNTWIDDKAIEYLAQCPRLEILRLAGTEITEASLPTLRRMNATTMIEVRRTRIAAEHRKEFRTPPQKPFGWDTKPQKW